MRLNNEALKKELTHNLKEKISTEVGIELQKGMDNLKQDLKDNIFLELGVNLQRGFGKFK